MRHIPDVELRDPPGASAGSRCAAACSGIDAHAGAAVHDAAPPSHRPQIADAKVRVPFQVHAVGRIRQHRWKRAVARQAASSLPARCATQRLQAVRSLTDLALSAGVPMATYPQCRFSQRWCAIPHPSQTWRVNCMGSDRIDCLSYLN